MTMPNPVALAANTVRQLGETANQTVQSLGNQLAQTSSTLLSGLANGSPLPPLPGVTAGNGGGGLLPTPQQLVPVQALQAISQLENAILPAGLPRPSAMLLGAAAPPQPTVRNGNGQDTAPTPENRIRRDVPAARTGVTERSGY